MLELQKYHRKSIVLDCIKTRFDVSCKSVIKIYVENFSKSLFGSKKGSEVYQGDSKLWFEV